MLEPINSFLKCLSKQSFGVEDEARKCEPGRIPEAVGQRVTKRNDCCSNAVKEGSEGARRRQRIAGSNSLYAKFEDEVFAENSAIEKASEEPVYISGVERPMSETLLKAVEAIINTCLPEFKVAVLLNADRNFEIVAVSKDNVRVSYEVKGYDVHMLSQKDSQSELLRYLSERINKVYSKDYVLALQKRLDEKDSVIQMHKEEIVRLKDLIRFHYQMTHGEDFAISSGIDTLVKVSEVGS